ncbi:MAG TPA: DMT family transporter [Paenibacillaceae bacterium]
MWVMLALVSAGLQGLRGIVYHWSSQRRMDRNVMLMGSFSMGALICLAGSWIMNEPWPATIWYGLVIGSFSFIANTAMFRGYATGKASTVALLVALPAVPVVFLAWLFWGETLSLWQWIAFAIIVSGVVLIRYSDDLSFTRLEGLKWGLIAMFFYAFNDLANKQAALAGAPLLPLMTVMFLTGTALFGAAWRIERRRRRSAGIEAESTGDRTAGESSDREKAWSDGKTYLWGLAVGLIQASIMIVTFLAFKYGVTGLVSAIISLNLVIVMLYVRLVVKEPFRRREVAGIVLALAGMLVLHLFG